MINRLAKWFLRRLCRNPGCRAYLEEELLRTNAVLNSPQMHFAPPGHFYSPLPDAAEVESALARPAANGCDDGIAFNADAQRQLLEAMAEDAGAFDWPVQPGTRYRYWLDNGYYLHGDAFVLFALLRRFAPKRVIEVGSGFSSALMLDVNEFHLNRSMNLCFIEPNPERLEKLLRDGDRGSATLLRLPVQQVPLSEFEALEANDVLFIDSSHVAKVGSDVNYLFFEVLPRLRPGVLVHVHDIFYPFEYPAEWLRAGRAWNELYLVRAFLQYNATFEMTFFNGYVVHRFEAFVRERLPVMGVKPGQSLWLRRK